MTTGTIPYRAPRDCCSADGDVTTVRREQSVAPGERGVWVRCGACKQVRYAERDV